MLDIPPAGAPERSVITAIRDLIRGRNNATGTIATGQSITLATGVAVKSARGMAS